MDQSIQPCKWANGLGRVDIFLAHLTIRFFLPSLSRPCADWISPLARKKNVIKKKKLKEAKEPEPDSMICLNHLRPPGHLGLGDGIQVGVAEEERSSGANV